MKAKDNLAAQDAMPPAQICELAESTLLQLVNVMNQETTLLRAGHFREAGTVTGEKTQLAQDYMVLARAIQRNLDRIAEQAPDELQRLRSRHDSLATQMADNLRVLATARTVAEDLLSDVSGLVGDKQAPKTYGRSGRLKGSGDMPATGISINRAL